MKRKKVTYEIYNPITGKTHCENENTYKMTNLDEFEAQETIEQMLLNAYRVCENEKQVRLLNKYGIPYRKRQSGTSVCAKASDKAIKFWKDMGFAQT